MEDYGNSQVARLPRRLKQFVVDQHYERYTAINQAVWRYVMRQNYFYLREIAYYPYIKGLEGAGLSIEHIPDLQTMNDHLSQIGWGAVTVNGFIPPAAFMEFQAYKVLVIAADIRQLKHIEYTPAPDIIHESAGHAPIIADPEYAAYLHYFGETGSKALFSRQDFELYEAVRKLSILKEMPGVKASLIAAAEAEVAYCQTHLGEPSEMALLSRLHWWTVEYGLIGTLENPKIYGAGLLSSIGESVSCMQEHVKKIPYSMEAVNMPFDITIQQPQLYVTPDFQTLMKVLNDFAAGMAFRKGGTGALDKALSSGNVCTIVLNSGIQLSGILENFRTENELPVYLELRQPSAIALNSSEIPGMSRHRFPHGICLPMGSIADCPQGLENCTKEDLHLLDLTEGEYGMLEYTSGWIFHGILKKIRYQNGKPVLLTWLDAELLNPEEKEPVRNWEFFELPLGTTVVSVFNGPADKEAFEEAPLVLSPAPAIPEEVSPFEELYAGVRKIREQGLSLDTLPELWQKIQQSPDQTWLLALELAELCKDHPEFRSLGAEITERLNTFADAEPAYKKLISDGLILLTGPGQRHSAII